MSELFAGSEMQKLSPKKAWERRHGVTTGTTAARPPHTWAAWRGELNSAVERNEIVFGESEMDVLLDLCRKLGLTTWEQEAVDGDG